MGALLEVNNPAGVILWKDAKVAQIVFEEMKGAVEGYSGVYQGSTSSSGQHGAAR
jgi:dUTP pyrophosphatase